MHTPSLITWTALYGVHSAPHATANEGDGQWEVYGYRCKHAELSQMKACSISAWYNHALAQSGSEQLVWPLIGHSKLLFCMKLGPMDSFIILHPLGSSIPWKYWISLKLHFEYDHWVDCNWPHASSLTGWQRTAVGTELGLLSFWFGWNWSQINFP